MIQQKVELSVFLDPHCDRMVGNGVNLHIFLT